MPCPLSRSAHLLVVLFGSLIAAPLADASDHTWRMSLDSADQEGSGDSQFASVSGNGRYVAFSSHAKDLVPGDGNFAWDIFVRDRGAATLQRVSVKTNGAEANSDSFEPSISDDGRYVVFESNATNLVNSDTNGFRDIFRHDRQTGQTIRVNRASGGANGPSYSPHVSGDGNRVVFYSAASNLVPGDINGVLDVFVRDIIAKTTTRVSTGPSISDGDSRNARISQDGRWVVFASDSTQLGFLDLNGVRDVFLHDLQRSSLLRVTDGPGWEANGASDYPDVSADGRHIVFDSQATNFGFPDGNGGHDIVLHDNLLGTFERVSVGIPGAGEPNGASRRPAISGDADRIAFTGYASNLVSGDTNGEEDIFVRERSTATTTNVSVGASGQANDWSKFCDISASGDYVAYHSPATNLVPADGNGRTDVFLRGPHFLFDLEPRVYLAADPFEFLIYRGYPPDPVLVAVTAVDGKPFFYVADIGRFDSQGIYSLTGTVPPGLAGLEVDLQALVGAMGTFEWTNPVTMQFG